jgi:hypothetical protein
VPYSSLIIQEAEIRRIQVQSQPGQQVLETLSQKKSKQKKPHHKKRADRVAQGVGPEFKPQHCKKKKKKERKERVSAAEELRCKKSETEMMPGLCCQVQVRLSYT